MSVTMKPFHGTVPGMPNLFHTYCAEHPEFGTCAEDAQAHRDIAQHLETEHAHTSGTGEEQ